MNDWRNCLPANERAVYERSGYGEMSQPGTRLAVLLIDLTYGFTGHQDLSDDANATTYPHFCGAHAWEAVQASERLADKARSAGIPVIATADISASLSRSVWATKQSRLAGRVADDAALVDEIAQHQPVLVKKEGPSAFFKTDVADTLVAQGVEDVLVTGCTTSGCVRATVVDAFSHHFNVFVVEEAVFDRAATSHAVSLYEMNQKYATVIGLDAAMTAVAGAISESA